MMNLTWKEIIESKDFALVSRETGEIFDTLEQALADGADFDLYQWDADFGWVAFCKSAIPPLPNH
jgi:hypothetical protein